MPQLPALSFKQSTPPEVAAHLDAFAYVFAIEAQRDAHKAAKMYGITPMLARRIMDTQPQWAQALCGAMQAHILSTVGDPKLTALHNLADALVTHPQAQLLAIPHPWTRQALEEGLTLAAKDCVKTLKWEVREVWDEDWGTTKPLEVLAAISWNDQRWEATLRIMEAEGVKGVRLMPVDQADEPVAGFGGMTINFIS